MVIPPFYSARVRSGYIASQSKLCRGLLQKPGPDSTAGCWRTPAASSRSIRGLVCLSLAVLASGCWTVAQGLQASQAAEAAELRERARAGRRSAVLSRKSWISQDPCSESTRATTEARCAADGRAMARYNTVRDGNHCLVEYSCSLRPADEVSASAPSKTATTARNPATERRPLSPTAQE